MLGECVRRFANSRNTADRAARFNGVDVQPLYHPPRLAPRLHRGEIGRYILSVGRLEAVKRVDLAIRALAHVPGDLSLVVAGTGTNRAALDALVAELDLGARVRFLGEVDDDTLIELYAGALGVVYPPYDEDYGYVTLETFLAAKPVLTTTDAGGPNEFVVDGENGRVTEPDPAALGEAMAWLDADHARAAALGESGYDRARTVTWTGVIETLIGA
jgi:glycosyltransferase involved in cell wall biosynthesis